jgi:hypothetical protein
MGMLGISSNGRHFTATGGKPFFWLGDTQWNLWRCHTSAEALAILENRKAIGFTVVQVMLNGWGAGLEYDPVFRVPSPTTNGEAYPGRDLARPNEAYFRHMDEVVAGAEALGLVLAIGLDHPRLLLATPSNARAWGRWVGERYSGRRNIIWVPSYTIPEGGHLAVTRLIAAGLREGAGATAGAGSPLMTCHPDPADPYCTSGVAHGEPWLDFNSIQTWKRYDLIHESVTADYRRTPARPVVMAEGAYEGGAEYGFAVTPHLVRKQAWWTFLSGGHHSYGHNDNWQVPPTWRNSLAAPGAAQVGIFRKVAEKLPWWDLVPDQSLLESDAGKGAQLVLAARGSRGGWAAVYVPEPAAVSVRVPELLAARQFTAAWVDPRTGETAARADARGSKFSADVPAGLEDALLVLRPN